MWIMPMLFVRSLIFNIIFIILSVLVPMVVILSAPFTSTKGIIKVASLWGDSILFTLKYVCGLTYEIKGLENIQKESCMVFSKHQSTWETAAFTTILPPYVWVLKKELLKLPFFGLALKVMHSIAIDRKAGKDAVDQIVTEGKKVLAEGLSIIIFPEGTRVNPREKGRYGIGGSILAEKAGCLVTPIAHNAGEFWSKGTFYIYPGKIQVSIGPAIDCKGKRALKIKKLVEAWIEDEMLIINERFDQQYPEKYSSQKEV
jgi:1-acyl-sn-glycerol-3-phosphate acyltransferase